MEFEVELIELVAELVVELEVEVVDAEVVDEAEEAVDVVLLDPTEAGAAVLDVVGWLTGV